jgi:AcrR family transcriptional regulator
MALPVVDDARAQPVAGPKEGYNLLGQRLGRKGQETRERILVTALRLIETSQDAPVTLSGVAREASVGMTTLYLYFPNLGDLVLAVLTRVMDCADSAFVDRLRVRWPDDSLLASSQGFLRAHYQFWRRHSRLLHFRNSYEDAGDARFLQYRNRVSRPLIELLAQQMDGPVALMNAPGTNCATVLVTGFERLATITTNPIFHTNLRDNGVTEVATYIDDLLNAEAELMALGIRHHRDIARSRSGNAACKGGEAPR